MLGLNLKHSGRWQIVEVDAAFNFRLREVVIHFIGEVRVRTEEIWTGSHVKAQPRCGSVYTQNLIDQRQPARAESVVAQQAEFGGGVGRRQERDAVA